jgi:pyruvate/2-oxoglutarate dehydrogenase complex dihydrolipoamide dehydrogenase (E3) component
MPVDYDLVIIGATATARAAAIEALNLQVRVALVLPQPSSTQLHSQRDFYPYALAQIAKSNRINRVQLQKPNSYPWKYARAAIDRLEQQSSWNLLAAMGVDTIVGMGEFCRRPQLAFNIGDRYLRARSYLVATGSVSHYPQIPGLQEVGYLVVDRLPDLVDLPIPLRWAIIGADAIGVEFAQTLSRLGCQVTLIVSTAQILPYENPEVANSIQAQLEADGVQIYLETAVTNVSHNNRAKLVIIATESIAVDEIFIALPDRPLVEPFNLLGVGVNYDETGIAIDNRLRTSHSQIYACGSVCGSVLGGYRSDGLIKYEAKIAVNNALSWRKIKVDYQNYKNIPWAVYTDPPLARVGMTIGAARNSDRQDLIILTQYLKNCPQAILNNLNSGFCQVVVTRTGQILGAEIISHNAPELIQIIALAIQQKLKITNLVNLPGLSLSYNELIYQTAQEWHTYPCNQNWYDRCLNWLRK